MEEQKTNLVLNGVPEVKNQIDLSIKNQILIFISRFSFIGRLLLTLFSLYSAIFILSFVLECYAISGGIFLYCDSKFLEVVGLLLMLCLAGMSSNILTIPLWEFFTFSFIKKQNSISTILQFIDYFFGTNTSKGEINKKCEIVCNVLFCFYGFFWLLSLILQSFSKTFYVCLDVVLVIILYTSIVIYVIIFVCYIVDSWWYLYDLFINKKQKAYEDISYFELIQGYQQEIDAEKKKDDDIKNEQEENENDISKKDFDILIQYRRSNLVEKIINRQKVLRISVWFMFKIAICIIFFIIFCITVTYRFPDCIGKNILMALYFIFILFPLIITFQFEQSWLICKFSNHRSEKLSKFYWVSFVLNLLIPLALIFCAIQGDDQGENEKFYDPSNNNINDILSSFRYKNPFANKQKKKVLSPACYSTILNFDIHQLIAFANDAYYYNEENNYTSLNDFKSYIFPEDFSILDIKELADEKGPKMVEYKVEINGGNKVTIFSIRGTNSGPDIYVDLQLYISSLFLTLGNSVTRVGKTNGVDSYMFRNLETLISLPITLYPEYTFVYQYIETLKKYYNKEMKDREDETIIFVGHSLGGGLAKLMGAIFERPSLSLSGPGINAFQHIWIKKTKINFPLTFIDIVPDMDLVPRVEMSGGTIYRIICKAGALPCHGSNRSMCMSLILCNKLDQAQIYCRMAGFTQKEIEEMIDLSNQ